MEYIRTYPDRIIGPLMRRAYVVDNARAVYMDHDYLPVLEGLTTDTIILEWDIALGAEDKARFEAHVAAEPGRVHVAPYRLYPVSTGLPEPVWAHRTADLAWIPEGQPWCDLFGLGLAYIPRMIAQMFTASRPARADDTALSQWHFHARLGPVPVWWDVRPVHLHY